MFYIYLYSLDSDINLSDDGFEVFKRRKDQLQKDISLIISSILNNTYPSDNILKANEELKNSKLAIESVEKKS